MNAAHVAAPMTVLGRAAVALLIRKQSGTNTVEVVDRGLARLEEIKKTLPQDIRFQVVRDQSRFIRRSMKEVQEHLLLGGFLAALPAGAHPDHSRSGLYAGFLGAFAVSLHHPPAVDD